MVGPWFTCDTGSSVEAWLLVTIVLHPVTSRSFEPTLAGANKSMGGHQVVGVAPTAPLRHTDSVRPAGTGAGSCASPKRVGGGLCVEGHRHHGHLEAVFVSGEVSTGIDQRVARLVATVWALVLTMSTVVACVAFAEVVVGKDVVTVGTV